MYIILALLIFSFIVAFHEFGHFLFAKLFGVGVTEFSIGFGPKIFKKKYKETLYSIRLLPLGGFCAMVGESDDGTQQKDEKNKLEQEIIEKDPSKSFANKPIWQRFLITLGGPLFNFILAFIISTIYVISFGSYSPAKIVNIAENTNAYTSELQAGDIIVSINGRHISSYRDVTEYNATHNIDIYNIEYIRDNVKNTVSIEPTYNSETNTPMIGITFDGNIIRDGRNPFGIIKDSIYECRFQVRTVFDSLAMLFTGKASVKDMSSIIGIVDIMNTEMSNAQEIGGGLAVLEFCIYMIVLLSTNLGIMNLLPLPALDGGRCLIYIIETLIRRPIPSKIENAINTVGFACLMILMVVLMFNDVGKIITN